MNLLVRLLDAVPGVLSRWARAEYLPGSEEYLALIDAADALDEALDLITKDEK